MISGYLKHYNFEKKYGVIQSRDGKFEAIVHDCAFEKAGVTVLTDMSIDFEPGYVSTDAVTGIKKTIAQAVRLPQ